MAPRDHNSSTREETASKAKDSARHRTCEVELGDARRGGSQSVSSGGSHFMNEVKTDENITASDEASGEGTADRWRKDDAAEASFSGCCLRRRPKKYQWGGKFVKTIEETKGNFSLYSDTFSVEGLHHAFDSSNSWVRTVAWTIAFIAFGIFFLFLTVPLVHDYNDRMVVTSVDSVQGAHGLPLPIITVCPAGSGFKCDCLLWKKLHCRYRYIVRNLEWMARFDEWRCYGDFDHFDLMNGTHPKAINPNCQDFDFGLSNFSLPFAPSKMVIDPCQIDPDIIENFPEAEQMTMDALYDRIVSREDSPSGPYITVEEMIMYASQSLGERVKFVNANDESEFPPEWINYRHMDWGRLQKCVQLRPPNKDPRAQQRSPGSQHGVSVLVHGISEKGFALADMPQSSPAVEVHVNLNQGDEVGKDDIVMASNTEFVDVAAGFSSTVQYQTKVFKRYQGWGSHASRTCAHTDEPRVNCISRLKHQNAGKECKCSGLNLIPDNKHRAKLSNWDSPEFFGCSITKGTPEYQCLKEKLRYADGMFIGLDQCPIPCELTYPTILAHTTKLLSEGQMIYLTKKFRLPWFSLKASETVLLNVGVATMDIEKVTERPVTSLSELMGQIGGNLGLWCGLSFLTMVEVIEFSVIAMLYSRGFYHNRGKNLKEALLNSITAMVHSKNAGPGTKNSR